VAKPLSRHGDVADKFTEAVAALEPTTEPDRGRSLWLHRKRNICGPHEIEFTNASVQANRTATHTAPPFRFGGLGVAYAFRRLWLL